MVKRDIKKKNLKKAQIQTIVEFKYMQRVLVHVLHWQNFIYILT